MPCDAIELSRVKAPDTVSALLYEMQYAWCLLTISDSLLPPKVQIVSNESATMGECNCFNVSPRWGGVGAIRCFHWLLCHSCLIRIAHVRSASDTRHSLVVYDVSGS